MRELVVWGAGGQAKVLAEFCGDLNLRIAAFFDRDQTLESPIAHVPIAYGEEGFAAWRRDHPQEYAFAVAVGGARGRDRLRVHRLLTAAGLQAVTLVHPRAYVASNAAIGDGGQILVHAVVGAEAVVGTQCIVNTAATVDHECRVGDGVHIAPGAHLAGLVRVGDGTFVGAGAIVLPRITIGEDCVIGAGAVVTKDVPAKTVVTGVPARPHEPPR